MILDQIVDNMKKETKAKNFYISFDESSSHDVFEIYDLWDVESSEDIINEIADDLKAKDNEEHEEGHYRELAEEQLEAWDTTEGLPVEGWLYEEAFEHFKVVRLASFLKDFRRDATATGDQIEIYRCVGVPDPEQFIELMKEGKTVRAKGRGVNSEGVGVYWSWTKDAAECHWSGGGATLTLTGLATLDSINFLATVKANMHPTLNVEKEIQLKAGSLITVTKVEKGKDVIYEGEHNIKASVIAALKSVVEAKQIQQPKRGI